MNQKKKNVRKDRIIFLLWMGISVFLILAVGFLSALYWLNMRGWTNTTDDFLASMGSYLGGVIGGIGALIAVFITVVQTRKIQNEDREAEILHMIVSCATKYIAVVEETYRLVGKYSYHKSEVKNAEHSIDGLSNSSDIMVETIYQKSKSEVIKQGQDSIERHQAEMVNTDEKLSGLARSEKELYHALLMHLKILGNEQEVIERLETMHNHYYVDNEENYLEGWPYTQIDDFETQVESICANR